MSGGSFDYLSSRAPDEATGLASQIQRMADALRADGFPYCASRTKVVVDLLALAVAEMEKLDDVWHAEEWRRSGDWARYEVRRAAVALGEPLPPCPHAEKRPAYGRRRGEGTGLPSRFLVCEECGDEFDEP